MTPSTLLRFLSLEQLLEMKENGEQFTLVEALAPDDYKQGHLPNAVNLPPDQAEAKASEVLPKKDAKLVVYCASYKCQASTKTARKLIEMGYSNVFDFKGGKKLWQDSQLPLEQ